VLYKVKLPDPKNPNNSTTKDVNGIVEEKSIAMEHTFKQSIYKKIASCETSALSIMSSATRRHVSSPATVSERYTGKRT